MKARSSKTSRKRSKSIRKVSRRTRRCADCGKRHSLRRTGGYFRSYCLACHAARQREFRKCNPMTPEQRFKDTARSYAGVYKKRGKLIPQPCGSCGSPESQMHHPDYNYPLLVEWLCRPCHLAHHREELREAA